MDEKEKKKLEEYFLFTDKTVYEILKENKKDKKDKSKPQLKDFMKYTRERLGYTQEEFARMLNIKQNTLSRYENGVRPVPFILFMDLCHELGYDMVMKQRRERYGADDEFVSAYEKSKEENKK